MSWRPISAFIWSSGPNRSLTNAPRRARVFRTSWGVLGVAALLVLPVIPSGAANAAGADKLPTAGELSLPSAPAAIGPLKRDSNGKIVPAAPRVPIVPRGTPAPDPRAAGPLNTKPAGLPPSAPPPPVDPQTLPGFGARPGPENSVFDPRGILSLQDRARHERIAARHQADIDRILREESTAKLRGTPVDSRGLTLREVALEQQLERIDKEVREHEIDHYRVGLPYGSLPEYWAVTGPLGKQYTVTGVTRFDVSEIVGSTEETLRKFKILRRAALAPRIPSATDRRIASELTLLIAILRSRR